MVDPLTTRLWGFRLLYVGLVALFVFLRLLPFGAHADSLPGPDFALALTFAWLMRRPEYVPAPLIVSVFLVLDLLFHQAPGLWTALVLLGTEFLRARQATTREIPFALEFGLVAGVLAAMCAMNHLILSLLFVERPPFGLYLLQAAFTLLVYPVVVLISALALNIRRATVEELALRGERA